jgi:hypothetical protein
VVVPPELVVVPVVEPGIAEPVAPGLVIESGDMVESVVDVVPVVVVPVPERVPVVPRWVLRVDLLRVVLVVPPVVPEVVDWPVPVWPIDMSPVVPPMVPDVVPPIVPEVEPPVVVCAIAAVGNNSAAAVSVMIFRIVLSCFSFCYQRLARAGVPFD